MTTRRQFCKVVGASSVLAGIPLTAMSSGLPSPFRATSNPSREHFEAGTAAELVARHVPSELDDDACEYADCICLDRYATLSPDALAVLSEREWTVIDFGITELTVEGALSLRQISVGLAYFHHIEYAHPEALAILLTETKLQNIHFENLVSIDPSGMEHLNANLSGVQTGCTVSLNGSYVIDEPTSRALLAFPLNYLSLKTTESLNAVSSGALSVLQEAKAKEVTINPGALADIQINAWPHEWSAQ